MIHKKPILILALLLVFSNSLRSQVCSPNPALKRPGTLPSNLPKGDFQVAYDQTISVMAFKDTTVVVGGQTQFVKIDSFKVCCILGLPKGLTSACWDPKCIYLPDSLRCIRITGTPSEGGFFPIRIPLMIYAKVSGFFSVIQPDTIKAYSISIAGGSAQIHTLTPHAKAKLVHAGSHTYALGLNSQNCKLFNLSGQQLQFRKELLGAEMQLFTDGLQPGLYVLYDGVNRVNWWVN